MSLLFQAIQEYLEECHPEWQVNEHTKAIHISHKRKNDQWHYIGINTTTKMLNYFGTTYIKTISSARHMTKRHTAKRHTYTESTLLPQITKAINHIEEP